MTLLHMQTDVNDESTNRDHHLADQRKHRLTNSNDTIAIHGSMVTKLDQILLSQYVYFEVCSQTSLIPETVGLKSKYELIYY